MRSNNLNRRIKSNNQIKRRRIRKRNQKIQKPVVVKVQVALARKRNLKIQKQVAVKVQVALARKRNLKIQKPVAVKVEVAVAVTLKMRGQEVQKLKRRKEVILLPKLTPKPSLVTLRNLPQRERIFHKVLFTVWHSILWPSQPR